jgi:predicted dehydrogenase
MKSYRVGIIGLGRMGSTICDEIVGYEAFRLPYSIAGACAASDRLELACGADTLPEKRQAFQKRWGCQALYEDFGEMIRQERPDMVAICTKGDNHAELAIAAADLGVPMMYLEKVMACSMTEAEAVREAILRNKTVFNTGVLRRFGDHHIAMRKLISEGIIGEPRCVIQMSGGTLMHSNIHAVDFAMFMLGEPRAARVRGEIYPRDTRIENNRLDHDPEAVYEIEFEDGTRAWQVPFGNYDVEVIGTEGMITSLNNGMDFMVRNPQQPPQKWARFIPEPLDLQLTKSATVLCLEDLVNSHETGQPSLNSIEIAHHSTEICLTVAESHRQAGAWVELPLKNRELYVWHV